MTEKPRGHKKSGKTNHLEEKSMKKFLLITGIALLVLSGCPKKEGAQPRGTAGGKLVIWSFTDELANMTNNPTWGFKVTHPGIDVEYSQTPSDQFQAKIDPVLATGQGVPDIIALESAFVRKYVESGLLLDVSDIYESKKGSLLAYPAEIGTYNGKVYGLSWQACPGAMFYRRSLAKKYFGTDDPRTVQTYFTNFNKFLETAKDLKDKSGGSCVVVSALSDLFNSFMSARKDPWIVNGKLVIDPVMEQYLDICKTLHDNRWEGRVGQWSEGWFAGMKGELKDEAGKPVEVFSYFLPTWGLHYVLKTNAPDTSGDWAMIPGPSSYRWGGTWVGAYKGTKNVAAAKEFIRYVATDEAFLEAWAKDTGDMVNNLTVVNKIKDSYSEPFLGGQNHYAEFAEMAKAVNGKLLQGSDEAIESYFGEAMAAFVNGEKTKAKALADFRAQAEAQFAR
jgi:ABC-type glycerol-3-phosphate transport system substrate-binding protein